MRPVGSAVPQATVHTEGPITLSEVVGAAPTLLVFFKRDCATSQIALPVYQHWRRQIDVLGVAQDEPDATGEFFDEFGIQMPVVFDAPDFEASRAFDIDAVPAMFLIEDGAITWASVGWSLDKATELAERIGDLSQSEPVLVGADGLPPFRPG